jgi:Uma2 family endonuclease
MGSSDQPLVLQRHRLTVDEYHRMAEVGLLAPDARVELIEGEIIDMAPIGSRHGGVVKRLLKCFSEAIGDRAILSVQDPLHLGPDSEPQPDVMLLAPRADFYTARHPTPADVLLLVEVADSSGAYDHEVKAPLYAHSGVRELWIVDLPRLELLIHRRPVAGSYAEIEILASPGRRTIEALPGITFDLTGLFD